jgi:hypothetical protein
MDIVYNVARKHVSSLCDSRVQTLLTTGLAISEIKKKKNSCTDKAILFRYEHQKHKYEMIYIRKSRSVYVSTQRLYNKINNICLKQTYILIRQYARNKNYASKAELQWSNPTAKLLSSIRLPNSFLIHEVVLESFLRVKPHVV